jgi:hypothetical protein
MNRRIAPPIGALLLGIIVGVALVAGSPHTGARSGGTGGCTPGPVIANVSNALTPYVLLNSPWNADRSNWSTQSSYIGNGMTFTYYAWDGTVWGSFNETNWTVRVGQGSESSGPPCDSRFYAAGTPSRQYGGGNFPLGSFANDSNEPSYLRLNASVNGGPIYYWNGFYRATSRISTCDNAGPQSVQFTSNHLTVGIPFTYGGQSIVLNVTIYQHTVFRYVFPVNAGTWLVDNLSAPGGPGGGWAFSYSPCP